MLYVELEGTDTTGKTTTCVEVCRRLKRRGYQAVVVPPARELIQGFMEAFDTLDPVSLIAHELRGYTARRRWASKSGYQLFFIDRGLITLTASSLARLIQAGYARSDAQFIVNNALISISPSSTPIKRYLLSYGDHDLSAALAHFKAREGAPLSAHYVAYQRLFIQIMNNFDSPVTQVDARFDACASPSTIHQAIFRDLFTMTLPQTHLLEKV